MYLKIYALLKGFSLLRNDAALLESQLYDVTAILLPFLLKYATLIHPLQSRIEHFKISSQ